VSLKDVVLVTPALATELSRSITGRQHKNATQQSEIQQTGVQPDAVLAWATAVHLVPAMLIKQSNNVLLLLQKLSQHQSCDARVWHTSRCDKACRAVIPRNSGGPVSVSTITASRFSGGDDLHVTTVCNDYTGNVSSEVHSTSYCI
jgi:hypothetical protein